MKDELISRRETIAAFWKSEVEFRPSQIDEVERVIKSIPAVEAKLIRHGRAIKLKYGYTLTCCDTVTYEVNPNWNYCPYCGAKMDAERKEE